jgi:hypothetical protein
VKMQLHLLERRRDLLSFFPLHISLLNTFLIELKENNMN